jgi:hypothetical protein
VHNGRGRSKYVSSSADGRHAKHRRLANNTADHDFACANFPTRR